MLDLGRPSRAPATPSIGLLDRLLCGEINFEEFERQLLLLALRRNKGNQSQTAKMLGMTRRTAQYRIAKFGIDPTERQENELASDAQRIVRPPGPLPQKAQPNGAHAAESAQTRVGTRLALPFGHMWLFAALLILPAYAWPVAVVSCLVAGPCRRQHTR